jgi:hypothetical protein
LVWQESQDLKIPAFASLPLRTANEITALDAATTLCLHIDAASASRDRVEDAINSEQQWQVQQLPEAEDGQRHSKGLVIRYLRMRNEF